MNLEIVCVRKSVLFIAGLPTYMQIEVGEYLTAIFEPGYVRARISSGHADESDFVSQYVFIIEMGSERNFSSLKKYFHAKWNIFLLVAVTYIVIIVVLV